MVKISAGFLMYRTNKDELEIFLVHHGGPYWENQDLGAWSIPKGIVERNESLLEGAKREFEEETGIKPEGEFLYLGEVKEKSGKIIHAWAFEKDWNGTLRENIISIEYPIDSGIRIKIPEIDDGAFFNHENAREKIDPCQKHFIKRLNKMLKKRALNNMRKEILVKFKEVLSVVIKNRNRDITS